MNLLTPNVSILKYSKSSMMATSRGQQKHKLFSTGTYQPSDASSFFAILVASHTMPIGRDWGFNAGGYNSPPEHMATFPFTKLTMPLGGSTGPSCWHPKESLFFPDPWNSSTVAMLNRTLWRACQHIRPFRENFLGSPAIFTQNQFPAIMCCAQYL